MTCKMDDYDCARPVVDMICNFLGIEIDSLRININKYGHSSDSRNSCSGGHESNRRNDYFIARLNPCRAQCDLQRQCAICHGYAMRGAVIGGKLPLQLSHRFVISTPDSALHHIV